MTYNTVRTLKPAVSCKGGPSAKGKGALTALPFYDFDALCQIFIFPCAKPPSPGGRLRVSKNRRLIQKEPRLQGEKGLEKGAEPSFPF